MLAVLAVPFLIPVDRYRPLLEWAVERGTGRQISIDKLQLYLVPTLRVRVVNFRMRNPTGFPAGDALVAKAVDLGLDPRALLSRRLDVTYIAPSDVQVNLLRDAAGHTNFGAQQSKTSEASLVTPSLSVDRIGAVDVKDARVTFADVRGARSTTVFDLSGIDATIGGIDPHAANWAQKLVIAANLRGAQLSTPLFERPVDFRSGDLSIQNGSARGTFTILTGGETLGGSAALARLDPFSIAFDVGGQTLDMAAVAALLRPGIHDATAGGAARLLARGTLHFSRVVFGRLEATQMRTQLAAYTDALRLEDCSFDAYGGSVRGDATVDTSSTLPATVSAVVRGMDVARALSILGVAGNDVTGVLDTTFKMTTLLAHDPEAMLAGTGTFSIRDGTFSHLNTVAGDGSFSYFGGDVRIARERAYSNRLRLITSRLRAVTRGSFGFDKSLAYSGAGVLAASGAAGFAPIPAQVQALIASAVQRNLGPARVRVPFRVGGTLDDPQFSLAGTPQLLNDQSSQPALQDLLQLIPGL